MRFGCSHGILMNPLGAAGRLTLRPTLYKVSIASNTIFSHLVVYYCINTEAFPLNIST
jgi:hypothetical protein